MLEEHLVERAADKVPLIRIQAALGLSRLQDVEEGSNSASLAYIRLLSSDPNKEVRRTALNNLVTSRNTLGPILDRVRDTNAEVRGDTFRLLATNVRMKTLSIKQRVFLLQSGMRDRDVNVRKECNNMLVEWLKSQGASVTALLKAFDVTNTDDKLIEMLIETVLDHVSLDSIGWRNADVLTPELAILWRVFIKWHVERKNRDIVEENLPHTLIEFCELVTNIVTEDSAGSSYILRQILQLSSLMDKADEGGRRPILGLLTEVMAENYVDEKDVEYLVRALYTFSANMEEFLGYMNTAITRARHLLDTFEREESTQLIEKQDARLAELKRKIGAPELKRFIKQLEEEEAQGGDDLEAIMQETDTSKMDVEEGESSGSWKKELRVLLTLKKNRTRASEWSWLRTLTLVQQIFAHSKISDLDPAFSSSSVIEMLTNYVPKYVAVAMANPHVQVRLAAMRALGGLATLEVKFNAIHHVELLYYALSNDQTEVKDEALKILFDLVMTAGFEVFETQTLAPSATFDADAPTDSQLDGGQADGESTPAAKKSAYIPREEDFEEISAPFEYPQQSVFSVLYTHLTGSDAGLLTTSVEGFTKLFVAKKIACPRTLSAMLVLLFDPETSENTTLQQSLSLFLPMFAFASYHNQRIFAAAFVTTLRRFLYADVDSPLADVHVTTFLRFMLHVTDWQELMAMHKQRGTKTSERRPEGSPMLHNLLAIDVCLEILVAPGSLKNVKALSKFFGYFPIDTNDVLTTRRLEHLLRKAGGAITDKLSAKAVNTVFEALDIKKSLPELGSDEIKALETMVAEATDGAMDTLEDDRPAAKPAARTKKAAAPPKSTKKLFATKSRRGVLEDSDDDLMDSDSDSDSLDSDSDSEDEAPVRKTVAKKGRATKSAKTTSAASKPAPAAKSVARVLYDDSDDDATAADETSAPAPKRRALADSDSDEPVPARVSASSGDDVEEEDNYDVKPTRATKAKTSTAKTTAKVTKASAKASKAAKPDISDDEDLLEDEEAPAPAKKTAKRSAPKKAAAKPAKAAAAKKSSSKTLTKTVSSGSITDEEKENAQNLDEPISRTGSTLSGKLSSVTISAKNSKRRVVEEESSEEEFEDSDAEIDVMDSDDDMKITKPAPSKNSRANTVLARAAAAQKTQKPAPRSAKSAEQSKLMKEMSAMLD